jgi:hypothetical protein
MKNIFRDKDKILMTIDEGTRAKRRRLKKAKESDLEAAVLTWFRQVRSQNVEVTGPLLKVNLILFSIQLFTLGKSTGTGRRIGSRRLQGE